jgi:hypothetical protein
MKQTLHTHSLYTLEEYLNQSRIMYCVTKFFIILVLILRFYLCASHKYSLIAYYEMTTFLCINLIYVLNLCIVFIKYYYYHYYHYY